MRIYDVSVPLSAATPTYPGDPGIDIKQWLALAKGDAANVSLISFGLHSGTHVDAPAHFIEGGARVESLPLESLIGEADVVEVSHDARVIDENVIAANVRSTCERVLFKTRNSTFWNQAAADQRDDRSPHSKDRHCSLPNSFREDYTYIHPKAAARLVEMGVKLVGIDYLSVEQFNSSGFETHHTLLSRNVVILEGLDLREVPAGTYELFCLPLKIAGGSGDGAPARVILRTEN